MATLRRVGKYTAPPSPQERLLRQYLWNTPERPNEPGNPFYSASREQINNMLGAWRATKESNLGGRGTMSLPEMRQLYSYIENRTPSRSIDQQALGPGRRGEKGWDQPKVTPSVRPVAFSPSAMLSSIFSRQATPASAASSSGPDYDALISRRSDRSPGDPKYMRLSKTGADFIHGYEKFRANAYDDGYGNLTIGWGHTGPSVKWNSKVTREEADRLFAQDVHRFQQQVAKSVKVPLTQGQYDALVSFGFNTGTGPIRKVAGNINMGDMAGAATRMQKYVNASGERSQGLVRRRGDEIAQLWNGTYRPSATEDAGRVNRNIAYNAGTYGGNRPQTTDPWSAVATRTQLPIDPRVSLTPGQLPAARTQTQVAGDPRVGMASTGFPAARQQVATRLPTDPRASMAPGRLPGKLTMRVEPQSTPKLPTYNMVRPAPAPTSLPARQSIRVAPQSTPKPLISPQEQIAYNASTYGAKPQTATQRVAEAFGPRLPQPMITPEERQTIPVTPKPVTTQSFPNLQQFPGMPPAPVAPTVPMPTITPPSPTAPGQGLLGSIMSNLPSLSTVKQGIQDVGQQVIGQAVKTYLGSGPVKLASIAGQSGGPQAFWNQFNANPGSQVNEAAASYQAAKMFMNPKSQQAYNQPRNTQGKFTSGGNYRSGNQGNYNSGGGYRAGEGSRYSGPGSGGYTNRSGGA